MLLDEASVTGTANILMAAVLAEGTTTIYNAACEPYLQQLCLMLNSMGAKITGIGSNQLTIEGVTSLNGCEHRCLPDMIEIGSFIGMAAITQSEITLKNCRVDMLGIIPKMFQRLGVKLEIHGDDIFIPAMDHYEIDTFIDGSILTVSDQVWPGFTPDLISIALVTATQARGTVLIHQKMFESRLFFVGRTNHSLRPTSLHRHRFRSQNATQRHHNEFTRHPCGCGSVDRRDERQRQKHHKEHRTNRSWLRAN